MLPVSLIPPLVRATSSRSYTSQSQISTSLPPSDFRTWRNKSWVGARVGGTALVTQPPAKQDPNVEQRVNFTDFYRRYRGYLSLEAMVKLLRKIECVAIHATDARKTKI
ncbi:hypothetical protein FS749_008797 [Ceratobasidium sp. UAMH 11750]|nr:hypothetical protein FS749_008797 [Ceratobasidium sp. UAMH 11750]